MITIADFDGWDAVSQIHHPIVLLLDMDRPMAKQAFDGYTLLVTPVYKWCLEQFGPSASYAFMTRDLIEWDNFEYDETARWDARWRRFYFRDDKDAALFKMHWW